VLENAFLTENVVAVGADGVHVPLSTKAAFQFQQAWIASLQFFFFLRLEVIRVNRFKSPLLLELLPLFLELPARLIRSAVMNVETGIAKHAVAGIMKVLAKLGIVIKSANVLGIAG
jgi:hypothetical protein